MNPKTGWSVILDLVVSVRKVQNHIHKYFRARKLSSKWTPSVNAICLCMSHTFIDNLKVSLKSEQFTDDNSATTKWNNGKKAQNTGNKSPTAPGSAWRVVAGIISVFQVCASSAGDEWSFLLVPNCSKAGLRISVRTGPHAMHSVLLPRQIPCL